MNPTFSGELMHFLDTTGQQFLENLTELLGFLRDNFGNLDRKSTRLNSSH